MNTMPLSGRNINCDVTGLIGFKDSVDIQQHFADR